MLKTFFDTNLALFERKNPLLSVRVCHAPLVKKLPFLSPLKWDSICLDNIDVVYAYGLEKHIYPSLIDWLGEKKERKLIFLEDDLQVMRYFLEL